MLGRIGMCVATVIAALGTGLVPIGARSADVAAAAERVGPAPTTTPAGGRSSRSPHAVRATSSVQAVPLRSSYETATRLIYRDIGLSVVLPDGHELWFFGDTNVLHDTARGWTSTHFIDGSSALEARYTRAQVPHGGEYPTGTPVQFLPSPKDVYLTDGSGRPCTKGVGNAAFPARWPTGAAVMPNNTSDVLLTYAVVCRLPARRPPGTGRGLGVRPVQLAQPTF